MLMRKALQKRFFGASLPVLTSRFPRYFSSRVPRFPAQPAQTKEHHEQHELENDDDLVRSRVEDAMVGVWEYPAGWNGLFVVGEYEIFRDATSKQLRVLEKQSRGGLRMESDLFRAATSPWHVTDVIQGYSCRLRWKEADDRMVSQFREGDKGDWEAEVLAQRKLERSRGQLLVQGFASLSATTLASCCFLGPELGLGAMLLLVTHESGHLLAMSLAGVRPKSITFVPLLGAAIDVDDSNQTAWREGQILLAGPLAGLSLATLLRGLAEVADHPTLFLALANLGFLCELINLMPFAFLDGSRLAPLLGPHVMLVASAASFAAAACTWHPVPVVLGAAFGITALRGASALRRVHRSSSFYEGIATKHIYLLSGGYLMLTLWASSALMFLPHSIFSLGPKEE